MIEFKKNYDDTVKEFILRTKISQKAYESAREVIAGGETRSVSYHYPYPITIEKANGSTMYDLDGNKYIDFNSNYTSMIHGNAHPKIIKSIQEAIDLGTAYPAGIFEQTELARILVKRVQGIERIRFCNSGTEATMFAVRTARAYKGKNGIIKMEGGYHGTTDMMEYNVSLPITPDETRFKICPTPNSAGISINAGKDLYIVPFNDLDAVERVLKENVKDIAGILVEPVLGAAGVIPPKEGYLSGLRSLADSYNVLLIFDEVQTLRLSLGGAQEKYGVIPDITVLAKIIGGGFPIGGFGGSTEIMSVYDPFKQGFLSQSGTFNGNRISMKAGIASMNLLDAEAINKLEVLSVRLQKGMKNAIERFAVPFSITRAGSLLNLHLRPEPPVDYATTYSIYSNLMKLYHLGMLNQGIFCARRGTLVLSTVMTEVEVDLCVDAFSNVMMNLSQFV